MSDLKERTDDLITKSFSICGCPLAVIKEFKQFCLAETKNDYSMGLKILLERNRRSFQQELLAAKIFEVEAKVETKSEKRTTFGSGGKDEQVE